MRARRHGPRRARRHPPDRRFLPCPPTASPSPAVAASPASAAASAASARATPVSRPAAPARWGEPGIRDAGAGVGEAEAADDLEVFGLLVGAEQGAGGEDVVDQRLLERQVGARGVGQQGVDPRPVGVRQGHLLAERAVNLSQIEAQAGGLLVEVPLGVDELAPGVPLELQAVGEAGQAGDGIVGVRRVRRPLSLALSLRLDRRAPGSGGAAGDHGGEDPHVEPHRKEEPDDQPPADHRRTSVPALPVPEPPGASPGRAVASSTPPQ